MKSAEEFYQYTKKYFIDKAIEHFIYRMERFNETSIEYDREITWYECENNDYNKAFEEKSYWL